MKGVNDLLKKVHLTPQMAKEILEKNYENNRKINWSHVAKLSSDIKNDNWNADVSQFNGAICIAVDGTLVDGQHRCQAVVVANRPIDTWIQYDVPKDAYQFLDNGLARRTSDYLNVRNATGVSAFASMAYCIEIGESGIYSSLQGWLKQSAIKGKKIRIIPSRSEVIKYVDENNEYLQMIFNQAKRMSKYLGSATALATTLFLIDYTGNGDMMNEFVEDMSKLAPESKTIVSAKMYMMQKINDKHYNSDNVWLTSCLLTAYECFRNNKNASASIMAKSETQLRKYEALMQKEREERKKRN